jgi:membrane associated rhomboid family serine protease
MSAQDELQRKLQQLEAELDHSPKPRSQPRSAPASTAHESQSLRQAIQSTTQDLGGRLLLPLYILAIPWAQELIDQMVFQGHWNLSVQPRTLAGLPGIFTSAFSHAGFGHLIANSIAFTIFSWLILAKSKQDYWITLLIGWVGGGLLCWLLGPQAAHGLSGVVYTLFGYLLAIGWLEKRIWPLLISIFVFINFSYVIFGVLPLQFGVAWWGHLFGLCLGLFSAYSVYRAPHKHSSGF